MQLRSISSDRQTYSFYRISFGGIRQADWSRVQMCFIGSFWHSTQMTLDYFSYTMYQRAFWLIHNDYNMLYLLLKIYARAEYSKKCIIFLKLAFKQLQNPYDINYIGQVVASSLPQAYHWCVLNWFMICNVKYKLTQEVYTASLPK